MDQLQQKLDKAKAFDVLKTIFDLSFDTTIMGLPIVCVRNDDEDFECDYCRSNDITQEQYEILKKARLE